MIVRSEASKSSLSDTPATTFCHNGGLSLVDNSEVSNRLDDLPLGEPECL